MTTQNSAPEQWTVWGAVCTITLSAFATPVISPSPRTQTVSSACCIIAGKVQPLTQAADDYTARVRQSPRRKAAMDKAAVKIAARLQKEAGGETVASLRMGKGLTQSELAKAAGMRQSYLSRIENNRQTIGNGNIAKLAAVLETSPLLLRAAFERQWDLIERSKS